MAVYYWATLAVIAIVLFIFCLEMTVCLKNGILEEEKKRFGTVSAFFKICLVILLIFSLLSSGLKPNISMNKSYFQKAFPLALERNNGYLADMRFVQPKNSDLYEAYGYSEMERLLVTLTKGDLETHYYPDAPYDIFEILATTDYNMDDFLNAWAKGEYSPYR